MMTTEGQRDVAAHGMTPETRRCNLQLVQHGNDVGGLPAPPIYRLIVRLVASTVSAGVDEDEAIGVRKSRDVSSIPPARSRPGQTVVEHQRLLAPSYLVVDTQSVVRRVRHRAVPISWGIWAGSILPPQGRPAVHTPLHEPCASWGATPAPDCDDRVCSRCEFH